jgi:hypothetical protein
MLSIFTYTWLGAGRPYIRTSTSTTSDAPSSVASTASQWPHTFVYILYTQYIYEYIRIYT